MKTAQASVLKLRLNPEKLCVKQKYKIWGSGMEKAL
jgi:hypothetical protein